MSERLGLTCEHDPRERNARERERERRRREDCTRAYAPTLRSGNTLQRGEKGVRLCRCLESEGGSEVAGLTCSRAADLLDAVRGRGSDAQIRQDQRNRKRPSLVQPGSDSKER